MARGKKASAPTTEVELTAKAQQVHWRHNAKVTLLDSLEERVPHVGEGSNFRDVDFRHACKHLNKVHAHDQNCPKTTNACQNQYVMLKKVFEGLEGWAEKSGMSYNNEEGGCGVVPETEAAWEAHTNLYPEIKPYRSKPWGELYDLMRKVCTKVVVKGKQVYVPHATPAPKFSKKAKLDESDSDAAESLPGAALDGDNDEVDAEGDPDGSDIEEIEVKGNRVDYSDDEAVIVGPEEQKVSASATKTVAVKRECVATTTPHVPPKRSRKTKTNFLDGLGDNVNKVTSALLTVVNHMGPSQPDASLPTPSVLEVPPIPSTPPSSAKRISTFDPSPVRMANTVMAVYKQERWLDPDDAAIFVHYLETNRTAVISYGAMLDGSASEDARRAYIESCVSCERVVAAARADASGFGMFGGNIGGFGGGQGFGNWM